MSEKTPLEVMNGDQDFTNNQLNILRILQSEIGKDISMLTSQVETLDFKIVGEGELTRKALVDIRDKTESIKELFDAKLNTKFETLEAKLNAKFETLEANLNAKFEAQSAKIEERINAQTWKILSLFAAIFLAACGFMWFLTTNIVTTGIKEALINIPK